MAKRIVYIEDNADIAMLYGRFLQKHGYEVASFGHPEPGLQAVIEQQPDMVLMDVQLPDMDGFEAIRRLKSNPQTSHIPVVVLSVLTADEDKQMGFAAGCDRYVTKPLSPAKLLDTINDFLDTLPTDTDE